MKSIPLGNLTPLACALALFAYGTAYAEDDAARQEILRQRLAEQTERLNALKRSLAEQETALEQLRRAVERETLAAQRGKGQENPQQPTTQAAQAGKPAEKKPEPERKVAQAVPAEQGGVLTPKGKYVLEPSLQYSYSSSNRVALIGYTIVPALLIGLIDVREVKRNTMTAALSGRVGITNRFELEARIPYVYRSDSTVSREVATGTAADRVFEASGRALGDIELGARYQLNDGGIDKPYYIGTLRFKTRTGRDPFDVVTDCAQRCIGNTTGTGLPLELPTGSGFYSLQGGITWLFPSDPAVFFGSATYLHNFKRSNVSRKVLGGATEFLGTIEPGDIIGFNFGMGLALNEKTTFSIGYDHNSVGRTKQEGQVVPGSVRTQLGTLLLGYSYRLNDKRTLSISVGAGLTRDTPDLTLSVKMPISY
ncbi:MAG: acetate kinase [Burkholderiales bacterium]|nr:acetate kinase [Burkholderiales bacterium]